MRKIASLNTIIVLRRPLSEVEAKIFAAKWADVAKVWARYTVLSSSDAMIAMAESDIVIGNFVIRYRTDVDATWTVTHRGEQLDIIGTPVDIGGRHRFLSLKVKKT